MDVPAEHILGGSLVVPQLFKKRPAVVHHVQPQGRQVAGGSRLVHGGAESVGQVVQGVHVEHRTVPGEPELNDLRISPLDLDGVHHDPEGLPTVPPLHLKRRLRVQPLHVHVRLVRPHDGEPPGHPAVVADGDAGEHRLCGADGGPARGVQMDHVAQGRVGDPPVWVVGHQDVPAGGESRADDPVVAPGGVFLSPAVLRGAFRSPGIVRGDQRKSGHGVSEPRETRRYLLPDQGKIHALRHRQLPPGRGARPPVRLGRPQLCHLPGQAELRPGIPQGHGGLHPEEGGLGGPWLRPDPRQLELHRKPVAGVPHVGVHPPGKGLQDPAPFRVVAAELLVRPRATVAKEPGQAVVGEGFGAHDLGQTTLPGPPVHLHLPESVLGLDEPLGEEEVVQVPCIDVGDTPRVPEDLHRLPKPWNGDLPLQNRQVGRSQVLEVLGRRIPGPDSVSAPSGQEHQAGGKKPQPPGAELVQRQAGLTGLLAQERGEPVGNRENEP